MRVCAATGQRVLESPCLRHALEVMVIFKSWEAQSDFSPNRLAQSQCQYGFRVQPSVVPGREANYNSQWVGEGVEDEENRGESQSTGGTQDPEQRRLNFAQGLSKKLQS